MSLRLNASDVRALQTLVGAKVDGEFGTLTGHAVIAYMKSLAGPEVWEQLQQENIEVATKWKQAALTALAGLATIATGLILTKKSARERVVSIAMGELGPQNPNKYWSVVAPTLVNSNKAWCGGNALWVLKKAGLAKDMIWHVGKGFAEVYRLPRVKVPQPGDIAYFDQPLQHHAIVKKVNADGTFDSVDGNQAGGTVKQKFNVPLRSATTFYSIQPLIEAA